MLPRGQRIGKYIVESYIGQGGMAVVYRVRHIELNSVFALKLLTTARSDIRDRLVREGRYQAGLSHPNVVAVHDLLDVMGSTALLMEYVDGPTLDRWLQLYQPTLEEAESLFRSIVEGVAQAHHAGLVHRDLKPSNVLLGPTAAGFVPKVCDFGIAKIATAAAGPADTHSNVAMGTPYYMAPEQIRDAKNVDQRADVFSLGCILFELVCGGERSFEGRDVLTVLNAVVDGKRLDPRDYIPTLEDRICRVIDTCLEVDRDKRYANCMELLEALGSSHGNSRVVRGLELRGNDWDTEKVKEDRKHWASEAMAATTMPRINYDPTSRIASLRDEATEPSMRIGDEPDTPYMNLSEEPTNPNMRFRDEPTGEPSRRFSETTDETTQPNMYSPGRVVAGQVVAAEWDEDETTAPRHRTPPGITPAPPIDGDAFTQPPMRRRMSQMRTDENTAPTLQSPRTGLYRAVALGMLLGMLVLGLVLLAWQATGG